MAAPKTSIYYKAYNPLHQALGIFALGVVVTLLAKVVNALGILEVGNRFPWMSAAAFLLVFALFNSISSLSAKDLNRYWTRSMLAYAGLAIVSALTAYALSSLSINEAGSYRWIFIVLTFGYLVFLSIIGLMKFIVEFAEKEDWRHPRKRKRKKKKN